MRLDCGHWQNDRIEGFMGGSWKRCRACGKSWHYRQGEGE